MRQVDKNSYGEAYFEGRKSNYWWTVGSYENFRNFPHWEEMLRLLRKYKDDGKLLILKRSKKVRTYKGLWGGVAGYIEENEDPYETAIKEIREEVGINEEDIILIKQLDPIEFTDFYNGEQYCWEIFPFLFKIEKNSKINIDWEHLEYLWISPSEIGKYDTVPRFKDIVSILLL